MFIKTADPSVSLSLSPRCIYHTREKEEIEAFEINQTTLSLWKPR